MSIRPGCCTVCGSELEKDKTCTECTLVRENESLKMQLKRIKDTQRFETANDTWQDGATALAELAVGHADALLKELEK